jgi:hypothetical protein
MKKLILLLLLLQLSNLYSQNPKIEYENFKLQDNKEIIWQKVFDINVSKDSILKLILSSFISNSFINNLKYENYTFNGTSSFEKLTNTSGTPIGARTEYNCFVKIDIKENKYRITVENIKFKPINFDFGGVGVNHSYSLEEMVVRTSKHEIRKNSNSRKMLSNFNIDLLNLLQLIEDKQKEDW